MPFFLPSCVQHGCWVLMWCLCSWCITLLANMDITNLGLTLEQRFGAKLDLIKQEPFTGEFIKQQDPTGLIGYYHIPKAVGTKMCWTLQCRRSSNFKQVVLISCFPNTYPHHQKKYFKPAVSWHYICLAQIFSYLFLCCSLHNLLYK